MTIIKSIEFDLIADFVQKLDNADELSQRLSHRIEDDEHFSSIINQYFLDVNECEQFIAQNSRPVKIVSADIDCYASSFEFTLSRDLNEDNHNEMIDEIDQQFSSNIRNYIDYIDVHASDYTVMKQLRLISYDEYLAKCLLEADAK